MATPDPTSRDGAELRALIQAYLSAAEAGRTLDRAGRRYTTAGVRSLRRALAQVAAADEPVDAGALSVMDARALERLGRRVVDDAGLPPSRLTTIVDALRGLSAYAGARRGAEPPPAAPLPWTDPAPAPRPEPPPWLAEPPPPRVSQSDPAAAPEARTPTLTMLALGAHVGTWIERILVIAFVLTACGHGVHGVLEVLDDYYTSERARRWSRNFIITYAILASLIAAYVIWTR